MKKLFSFFIALFFIYMVQAQNVGIGTTTPASSAKLDVNSTTQGFLPPRMTIEQRNAILSPVAGLVVWCSTCGFSGELQVYNGAIWTTLTGGISSVTPPSDTICNQIWMVRNLEVTTYRNGDQIPQVTDTAQWNNLTTGAWCYYNNDAVNGAIYGKLYNWYAVADPRGLAPVGWHIPSDHEFNIMTICIDPLADTVCQICNTTGGNMKETGTAHWASPNTGATNSSGFTGRPGGYRYFSGPNGFNNIETYGYWWTSTQFNNNNTAYYRYLSYSDDKLSRFNNGGFNWGHSVRCVRD